MGHWLRNWTDDPCGSLPVQNTLCVKMQWSSWVIAAAVGCCVSEGNALRGVLLHSFVGALLFWALCSKGRLLLLLENKVQGALHVAKWGRSLALLIWEPCKWSHTLQSLCGPWIPCLLRDPPVWHLPFSLSVLAVVMGFNVEAQCGWGLA